MLSLSVIKRVQSLKRKKIRNDHQLFVVEGVKSVEEVIKSVFEIKQLFCLKVYEDRFKGNLRKLQYRMENCKKLAI